MTFSSFMMEYTRTFFVVKETSGPRIEFELGIYLAAGRRPSNLAMPQHKSDTDIYIHVLYKYQRRH
jgi:hypothetical protein